jgi:cytochrome oxidase Cu insertion factor (SCO1/SenC/PrrC family)
MPESPNRPPRTIWVGFVLFFAAFALAFGLWLSHAACRPVPPLLVIGPVADFTLTNQAGNVTTLADLTNRVWVADIVFTRCAGPCPRMTQQMRELQDALPPDSGAKLVTLTTDPEFDTPEVMRRFGERFGADFNRWTFLTGTKHEIGLLAANSLKLSAQPVKPEDQKDAADLFIHTTIFVIVDKQARLRGFFETGGDGVDWTNTVLPKIVKTVKQLEKEPPR